MLLFENTLNRKLSLMTSDSNDEFLIFNSCFLLGLFLVEQTLLYIKWLSKLQKLELAHMIQDQDIGDDAVYERIFEFYETADSEKKANAENIIASGCKRFIARMFGEDTAEVFFKI